jgi:hypothetical protein
MAVVAATTAHYWDTPGLSIKFLLGKSLDQGDWIGTKWQICSPHFWWGTYARVLSF